MTIPGGLPPEVTIREVGPRDGLQPEAPIPVDDRVALVEHLIRAGLRRIELGAFVSPKAVPAMAGSAEVFARVAPQPDLVRAALVPNTRGAEMARDAGADEITVTISASETYNQRNVSMSTAESVRVIGEITALASAAGIPVDAVVSCAFGSPYEGEIAPVAVSELAAGLVDSGVDAVTFADTTGMATPRRVHEVLDAAAAFQLPAVGLHLHDTRGTALVNAYAALERGVTRFDTAVGGVGGSPFAHGAGGNLATEGLVALLDDLGVSTGIDVDELIVVAANLASLLGRSVPSPIASHGTRLRPAHP